MIEKLDIATAGLKDKLKNTIASGIATPPPPIPATFASSMNKENSMVPNHSLGYRGNNGLCIQTFWVLPFGKTQRS